MSVYRDTNATVTFAHPFPGPLDVAIYRDGIKLREVLAISPVSVPGNKPNVYTLNLTYDDTQFDGKLDFVWSNGTFTRTTSEEVITPLISIEKLRTLFEDANWSDDKLRDLENSVRISIQNYTKQNFGYYIGSRQVVGNGDRKVALPGRLLRAITINGGPPGYFTSGNNGWYLYLGNKNYFSIKEMPPEDYIDNNLYMTQGVIVVPDTYWKQFRVGARYTITGEWGYYSVPDDIQEAAYLLANDVACGDSVYRDRYIESIKSADWNLVFNTGAYAGTGNVRVDQLLNPYRREGMVII